MVCEKCGREVNEDWSFCLHCAGKPVPGKAIQTDPPKARASIPLSFWLTALAIFFVIGIAVASILLLAGNSGFKTDRSAVKAGVPSSMETSAPAKDTLQAEGFREGYWEQIPISIPAFHFGVYDPNGSNRTDSNGDVFYELRYENVAIEDMSAYADELEAEGFYISFIKDKDIYSIQAMDIGAIEGGPSVYAELDIQNGTCVIYITIALQKSGSIVSAAGRHKMPPSSFLPPDGLL